MSKPDTCADSNEVLALKEKLASLSLDSSDWAARHRKWLQSQIRAQRLQEARTRGTHTKAEWTEILERFEFRCVRCGCKPDPRPCKDHIIPICVGGSDASSNLQPMCRECNTSKGLDVFNWAEYRLEHGFDDSYEDGE